MSYTFFIIFGKIKLTFVRLIHRKQVDKSDFGGYIKELCVTLFDDSEKRVLFAFNKLVNNKKFSDFKKLFDFVNCAN